MSKRTPTKHAVATTDLDPVTVAHQKTLARQRTLANRKLLKRRRQKSGQ